MGYKENDIVVHATGGVSQIVEIKIMNYGFGDITYYCLRPYFLDNQNKTLIVYVPESKSSELMRPIITKEEANALLTAMHDSEPIWYDDVKIRKEKFSELYQSGDLNNVCKIIKSLYLQQQKLAQDNKSLNLMDYDYLNKLKKGIEEELAVSLDLPKEAIEQKIKVAVG